MDPIPIHSSHYLPIVQILIHVHVHVHVGFFSFHMHAYTHTQTHLSSTQDVVTVAEDLRICTVKCTEELERRFCFEVVTPIRSCMLQADSEALRKKWVTYLEAGIARALRISASNKVGSNYVAPFFNSFDCLQLQYLFQRLCDS